MTATPLESILRLEDAPVKLGGSRAMWARRFEATVQRPFAQDDLTELCEQVARTLSEREGYRGAFAGLDPARTTVLGTSLWASLEDLERSAGAVGGLPGVLRALASETPSVAMDTLQVVGVPHRPRDQTHIVSTRVSGLAGMTRAVLLGLDARIHEALSARLGYRGQCLLAGSGEERVVSYTFWHDVEDADVRAVDEALGLRGHREGREPRILVERFEALLVDMAVHLPDHPVR